MSRYFNVDKEMEWYSDRPYIKTKNNYVKKENPLPRRKGRPIEQCDLNGKQIKTFKSVKEAASELNIIEATIYNYLKDEQPKKFVFKYLEQVK